ncbi:butyrophilin-like protein 2 [Clarias gariepinus]|uniref:butyrophilin-like protein 2 n=1 Tax=Clarias gariepinus TaxID=13013 RepID=UPI00234C48C4|nr:butyrophilin-like protein 2 [Clarias gariepinus]
MSASTRTSHAKFSTVRSSAGDTVNLHCKLSDKISKVTSEIRWFKGTECIHQEAYGEGGTLMKGDMWVRYGRYVSLTLRDVKVTDSGQYRCEAHGERKEEVAIIYLHVAGFNLISTSDYYTLSQLILGDDVTLSCHLSPKISAVAMEIRWFKGTDCICLYQNRQVKEGKGYEGRVSLFTHELEEGNVSLMLRNVQESDSGEYKCKVAHGRDKVASDQDRLQVSELKLVKNPFWMPKTSVAKPYTIYAWSSDDATLPCYLSPKRNAVAMMIRWFKGTDCICLYQNGQVKEGKGYEGRVSLLTHELEKGNVSLTLRSVQKSDVGDYKCEAIHRECKVENNGVFLQNAGN